MAAEVNHERWMQRALDLAQRGTGRVSPNPRVGCVIVDGSRVLAEGWHDAYGGPHAERDALSKLVAPVSPSATMYVTLEPCNHHGKRPPCTDAILDSGIKQVVVGMQDPYPAVDGRGLARLRDHGIQVTVGVLEDECRWLNRWFIKHGTTGVPYVLLKLAMSADGMVAPEPRSRRQLTGADTLRTVHRLRAELDAVMVGLRTVQIDDPSLTVREVEGRDPIRIVVDPDAEVSLESVLVRTATDTRTFVVCSDQADMARRSALEELGVELLAVPGTSERIDLDAALTALGDLGIASILCEGGAHLATRLLETNNVDELRVHTAPVTIGPGHRVGPLPTPASWTLHALERSGDDTIAVYLPASA